MLRLEMFIVAITGLCVYNAYTDGVYAKYLLSYKKYLQMAMYLGLGIGVYYLLKTNPMQSKTLLSQATNYVKYLPIDRHSVDMLSPFLDLTRSPGGFASEFAGGNDDEDGSRSASTANASANASANSSKRAVSAMRKKYVAAQQQWKCGQCRLTLDHTYEIDHRVRLDQGGTNDVTNLIALCPACHRHKTAVELML